MPCTVDPVIPDDTMSSVEQPRIVVDDELTLRPFATLDAGAVMHAFADPDIRLWHGFRVETIAEAQKWVERTHELWREEKSAVWAIVDDIDEVFGRCALHIEMREGRAEIAYWVLPEARRRGIAVRATVAVTAWAHAWLGVHRVLLQHSTMNPASCSVARRAGYTAEGTARQQDLHADGWHDMHHHAHLAGD